MCGGTNRRWLEVVWGVVDHGLGRPENSYTFTKEYLSACVPNEHAHIAKSCSTVNLYKFKAQAFLAGKQKIEREKLTVDGGRRSCRNDKDGAWAEAFQEAATEEISSEDINRKCMGSNVGKEKKNKRK
ncbi:unnamed protein product [Lactuca saligna]|uniref:Uncharacterized protein n=1 Tax=Lactuca saligna TaxID=75948 RepID=A0AA35Y5R1_LACSI|nr:unnamed protein product [Lactuca saligna]